MAPGVVCNIDFFVAGLTLPRPLADEAERQRFRAQSGSLIAVRTLIDANGPEPVSYQFDRVGNSPKEIKEFMYKLSREDGTDLGEAVKRAFGDEEDA